MCRAGIRDEACSRSSPPGNRTIGGRKRFTNTSPSATASRRSRAFGTSDFKYVRYFDHGNHEFLHDLKNDPDELVNLAGDPKHAEDARSDAPAYHGAGRRTGWAARSVAEATFTASTVPHPEASAAVGAQPDSDGFVQSVRWKAAPGMGGRPQVLVGRRTAC